ncbi:hypothetical protein J6590_017186 [Homalodisca vitripennis]|nr:hypothetical protein J6590_017186 [Homalodisca vitripennis]
MRVRVGALRCFQELSQLLAVPRYWSTVIMVLGISFIRAPVDAATAQAHEVATLVGRSFPLRSLLAFSSVVSVRLDAQSFVCRIVVMRQREFREALLSLSVVFESKLDCAVICLSGNSRLGESNYPRPGETSASAVKCGYVFVPPDGFVHLTLVFTDSPSPCF